MFKLAILGTAAAVSLDREPLLTWKSSKLNKGYPEDYFVPNFGVDHEIKVSHANLQQAEKQLKRKWIVTPASIKAAKKTHPMNYFVPNFGVDSDILQTQQHMKDAEKLHKNPNWNPEPFQNRYYGL